MIRHAWLVGLWLCLLTASVHAARYIDDDLDGVDDRFDRCLGTPFDTLVDRHGCPLSDESPYTSQNMWTLQVGATHNSDETYENDTLLNFYATYQTKQWDIAVASSAYRAQTFTGAVETRNDMHVTVGYTIPNDRLPLRLSLGTTFRKDQKNDYYAAIDAIYRMNGRWAVTAYYAFTLAGETNDVPTQNHHTLSSGITYAPNARWYLSLAYNHITPVYNGGDSYRTLSLYGAYQVGNRTFVLFNYAYGLNDEAYDHSVGLSVGVRFE